MTPQGLGKVSQVMGDGAEAGRTWKSGVLTAGCGQNGASHGGGEGHSWPRRQGASECGHPSLKRGGSEDRGASGRGQARLRMEGRGSGAQREVLGLDCKGGGGRTEKHPQGRRPRRGGAQEGRHLVASPLLKGCGWSW